MPAFDRHQLPFQLAALPKHFTPFREAVENITPPPPAAAPDSLPPPPRTLQPASLPTAANPELDFQGGENTGRRHLTHYIHGSAAVLHYRQTRNELQGQDSSSRLSPWLADGSLSVRRVAAAIFDLENSVGRNESTRHLYQELLWREFFQWYAWRHGRRLFAFEGPYQHRPLTTHYPARLRQWCDGNSPYPIVNACMRQLNATGWLSNRGRQLAASCLVNELSVDWRYGAAYFQSRLLDHDLASNWGNWQYIAGVGADPRGGRHFNLKQQTRRYDGDASFRGYWLGGQQSPGPLHHVDAADWPLPG